LRTYRWLDLSSGEATDGPQYTISTPGEYSLECTASDNVTFAVGGVIQHSVSVRYYINGMYICLQYSIHVDFMHIPCVL